MRASIGLASATPRADAQPFGPDPLSQRPPNVPTPAYGASEPTAPPPGGVAFREGYHDQTFIATAAPTYFGGFTIDSARAALEEHDSGTSFYFSSILAVAMTRFPPVYSALGIRCAPAIERPRQINGGPRGLPRIVREQAEAMICPPGDRPSPYFPPTLWGAIEIDLAMMGFAVLQHVYGPPDLLGRRMMYTRRWPPWAVYYQPWRKTYIAIVANGPPIDILNDGKFTLIGKSDIPHLQGAIRSLVLPVFDGMQTMQARAQWIDRFSDPKFIGTMPEGQGPRTPEGQAFYQAIATLRGPGGYGALPHGSDLKAVGLSAEASAVFKETLESDNGYIAQILTGVDPNAQGGVYKSIPMTAGILHSTVGDDLAALKRGVNSAIDHFTQFNYGSALRPDQWPALDIPLPDPEADARFDAAAKRQKAYTDQLKADRDAGLVVDADRNAELATIAGAEPGVLASTDTKPVSRLDLAPTDRAKVVRVDEARRSMDLEPIGDDRGGLTISELDQQAKAQPAPDAPKEGPPA